MGGVSDVFWGRQSLENALDIAPEELLLGGLNMAVGEPLSLFGLAEDDSLSLDLLSEDDENLKVTLSQRVEEDKVGLGEILAHLVWVDVSLPLGIELTVGEGGVVPDSEEVRGVAPYANITERVGFNVTFNHPLNELADAFRDEALRFVRALRDDDGAATFK